MSSASPEAPLPPIDEAEAKAAFHLRLRARGVRDLAVLRAFELTPRAHFVPPRYAGLAARDLPLPLPCGQTSREPSVSARAVEALGIEAGHRVLEVGAGSGYVTAVLAQLAGAVIALERYASLAEAARARLEGLGFANNAALVWADGLAVPPSVGLFDRVLVHAALGAPPPVLMELLAPGGRLVAGWTEAPSNQALALWSGEGEPAVLCPSSYASLVPGLSAAL